MLLNRFTKALAVAMAVLIGQGAAAQSYPSKPIQVVVPYPAGGAADFVARFMTKEMTTTLKQPMLVDNVAGVGGALGTTKIINAVPDGHNILLSGVTELILTPLANSNAKYKPDDLKTVAMLGQTDIMLVVRKELAVTSVEELIALAQKSADKPLSYCSSGLGSQYHLIAEKFNAIAGTKSLHVPYSGFPQCVQNIVGQLIDYAFLPIAGPFPGFVDNGSLKIIGTTGAATHKRFGKATLLKSSKGFDAFVFTAWAGIHVSNKVPEDVVAVLNKSARAALDTQEVKGHFAASGSVIFDTMSPVEAHAFYLREVANYQAIAKSINLQQQ